MWQAAIALVYLLSCACEKTGPPPHPEVVVGGPYRGQPTMILAPTLDRNRALETDTIARGQPVFFAISQRAVYGHSLAIDVVDVGGRRCYHEERKFTEEEYRTNPTGWGGSSLPLPHGPAPGCSEGDYPDQSFLPGHYIAKFFLDGKQLTARVFDVK